MNEKLHARKATSYTAWLPPILSLFWLYRSVPPGREVKASNESHQSYSLEQRGGNVRLLACAWFSVCAQIQFSPPRLGSDSTSSGLSLPMSVNLTRTIVHRQPDLDSQSLAETLPGWLWVCQVDSTTFTQSVIHWSSHEAQPWSLMGIAWIPPPTHTHTHIPSPFCEEEESRGDWHIYWIAESLCWFRGT